MDRNSRGSGGTIFMGSVLIVAGLIWIMRNLGHFDFSLREWWPLILIAVGILIMVNHRDISVFPGWLLVGLGVIFLLKTHHIMEWDYIKRFWPVAIILVGLSILAGPARKKRRDEQPGAKENWVTGFALFSGFERKIRAKSFRGGSITALFGGADLDLREATLNPDGGMLDLTAIFGGVDVKIPENWNMEINSTALFGGVGNKSRGGDPSGTPPLVINATAIFGGVEIRN